MKTLELKKIANDLAYSLAAAGKPAVDAAIAAKATELEIPEGQYDAFKASVQQFRSIYAAAVSVDAALAARPAARTVTVLAAPAPTPTPVSQPDAPASTTTDAPAPPNT